MFPSFLTDFARVNRKQTLSLIWKQVLLRLWDAAHQVLKFLRGSSRAIREGDFGEFTFVEHIRKLTVKFISDSANPLPFSDFSLEVGYLVCLSFDY